MSSKQPSKSVFVGNIPYGLTEEQIIRIFSSAGKVLNFRLVYDRETGRPKGFGFVEFPDSDSASSAVRNLNDYEIMNRKLRVDFSNDGNDDDNSNNNNNNNNNAQLALPYQAFPPTNGLPQPSNSAHIMAPQPNPTTTSSIIPPLPLGVDVPPGLSCPDAISRTLNTLPPQQLLDVLSQMKTLATTDAAKATELLHQAPQLSYAIFQALLLMNLISTEALGSVVEQATAAAAPINHQVVPQVAPQVVPPQQPIPPVYNALPPNTYPQSYAAPQQSYGVPQPRTPSVITQPSPQPVAGGLDTEQLMQQVLAMPQELIDTLPVAERNQLLALRASYGR